MNGSSVQGHRASARVLIVDDESAVRASLHEALNQEDAIIEEAASGKEALDMLALSPFELVLTDIRMDEMSGLDLLAQIKNRWQDTVVILLTGYASLDSAIQALRQGAHDYLIKPVSIHELRASVREGLDKRQELVRRRDLVARLREDILELSGERAEEANPSQATASSAKAEQDPSSEWLRIGDLTVDRSRLVVAVAGTPVALTSTEFRLLMCLLDNRGSVVRYQDLVEKVQGYECDLLEARQLIIPHVSNLRRKLRAKSGEDDLIENVRGVGYVFP